MVTMLASIRNTPTSAVLPWDAGRVLRSQSAPLLEKQLGAHRVMPISSKGPDVDKSEDGIKGVLGKFHDVPRRAIHF